MRPVHLARTHLSSYSSIIPFLPSSFLFKTLFSLSFLFLFFFCKSMTGIDAAGKTDPIPFMSPSKAATVHCRDNNDNQSTTSTKHSVLTIYDPEAINLNNEKCRKNAIDETEQEEHPYRWYILIGGFLAQAVSNSILSSW